MNKNKGFTLIELLVVIAIIGILSAIVLTSLSGARNKASDAKIQSQLSSLRASAEMNAIDNGNSYANVCSLGIITASSSWPGGSPACLADATSYRVSHQLISDTSKYWCVDNTGASILKTSAPTGTSC